MRPRTNGVPRSRAGRLVAALVLGLVVFATLAAPDGGVLAQSAPADVMPVGDWEVLNPGFDARADTIDAIYTPASGPLFITTFSGYRVYRGDDAGATWSGLPRAERARLLTIDPTDHQVMYFEGPGGLYKSTDGGATVEPILATDEDVRMLEVSSVDHDLVYLGTSKLGGNPNRATLYRSRDGGLSWEQIDVFSGGPDCHPYPQILYPHPTDADQLFYAASCSGGRERSGLRHSGDRGASWTGVFDPPCGTLRRMTGGRGSASDRFYLHVYVVGSAPDCAPTRSIVFRGEDDATTWTPASEFAGTSFATIADHPDAPDRVYAALHMGYSAGKGVGVVKVSEDGGATWADLGSATVGHVLHLAAGIDGKYLFAAGRGGLWRIQLR